MAGTPVSPSNTALTSSPLSPPLSLISNQVEEERKPPPVEDRPARRGRREVEEDTDTGVM